MSKKFAVALTEVVQPGLAIGGPGESVTWTFAVAGKQPAALAALFGELVALVGSEFELTVGSHHLYERRLVDIT